MRLSLVLAVALFGCGDDSKDKWADTGTTETTDTPTVSPTTPTTPTIPTSPDPGCYDVELLGDLPLSIEGSTRGAENYFGSLYCAGGERSPDQRYLWSVPADGRYRFNLETDYDAVLALMEEPCGEELACVDAVGLDEELVYDLLAGSEVVIAVDGWDGEDRRGDFVLELESIPEHELDCSDGRDEDGDGDEDCRDEDCWTDPGCAEDCSNLEDDNDNDWIDCHDPACAAEPECAPECPQIVADGTLPERIEGSTTGAPSQVDTACEVESSSDIIVSYTAPEAGDYVFSLLDSDFDTILSLVDGCGGAELSCNNNWADTEQSQLALSLAEGEEALLVVSGYGGDHGDFELYVEPMVPAETMCADGHDSDHDGALDCLDSDCALDVACPEDCEDGYDNDLDGDYDCIDAACADHPACEVTCPETILGAPPEELTGWTRGRYDQFDPSPRCADGGSPDRTFEFVAPEDGDYEFNTDGSGFDTVLYVLSSCDGKELDCDDDSGEGTRSKLTITLTKGQSILVVVDGYGGDRGEFILNTL
jgi:hypothetical protein